MEAVVLTSETMSSPPPRPRPADVIAVATHDAYQAMNYNQQLIQFADSKAGNLIVINSLFIAAAQAGRGPLQAVYVLLACGAVLACLAAISTRGRVVASDRKDLLFFGDILSRGTPARYIRDFRAATPEFQVDSTLRRAFVLAEIAEGKFKAYALAQKLTVWAAVVWVGSHVLGLF